MPPQNFCCLPKRLLAEESGLGGCCLIKLCRTFRKFIRFQNDDGNPQLKSQTWWGLPHCHLTYSSCGGGDDDKNVWHFYNISLIPKDTKVVLKLWPQSCFHWRMSMAKLFLMSMGARSSYSYREIAPSSTDVQPPRGRIEAAAGFYCCFQRVLRNDWREFRQCITNQGNWRRCLIK